MSRTFDVDKMNNGRYVSYKSCRQMLINHKPIRELVKGWYNGPLTDLFSWEGRFMLRRLVVRAHNELVALRWMSGEIDDLYLTWDQVCLLSDVTNHAKH